MSDGSYKLHTDISPRLGFIAYYGGGIHSGVVKSIDVIGGGRVTTLNSKWGMGGLYSHSPTYSPYSGNINYYYRAS